MVKSSLIRTCKKFIELLNPGTKKTFKIDSFWLRDHCRCRLCYNTSTHQIMYNLIELPLDITASNVETRGDQLNVKWSDGHDSVYSLNLLSNMINFQTNKSKILWDKNKLTETLHKSKVPLNDYLKPDGFKSLLSNILTVGLGIVTEVEPTLEATEKVVTRMTHVQKTFFGDMWEVTNDLHHEDLAYTNVALEVHNDNTYFNEAAGLQVFHLLSHDGTGGETLLVDGFNAANNLKREHPQAFDLLCKTGVGAEYIGEGLHYYHLDNVIKLHCVTKDLLQIRYNIRDRATLNAIPQDKVRDFYKAYKLFGREIHKGENEFKLKLEPGSVIFIDNWRVLHGRASYTGIRKLCGCYISRSDWLSKAKALGLN